MPEFQLKIYGGVDGFDPIDDNIDVEVSLLDGRTYALTFFTVQNLKTLMQRHRLSGESAGGSYVWAADMIVVDTLSEEIIRKSIAGLMERGLLEMAGLDITPTKEE